MQRNRVNEISRFPSAIVHLTTETYLYVVGRPVDVDIQNLNNNMPYDKKLCDEARLALLWDTCPEKTRISISSETNINPK